MLAIPLLWATTQLSTVAIDLPESTAPDTVARVVESCNEALGGPRCQTATGEMQGATLYAIVRWEGTELKISLRRGGPNGVEVDRRKVFFSAEDAPRDRFIAAGLMVAALTAAQSTASSNSTDTDSEPPETPPETSKTPEAATTRVVAVPTPVRLDQYASAHAPHWGFDLEAQTGPGLRGQPLRWGGSLAFWWLAHAPRLGLVTTLTYLHADNPVALDWASAGAGLRARLTPFRNVVGVELSTQAVVERVGASATRLGKDQSVHLWRPGGSLETLLVVNPGGFLQLFVSARGILMTRGFSLRVGGETVGSEPRLGFTGGIGLRIAPF